MLDWIRDVAWIEGLAGATTPRDRTRRARIRARTASTDERQRRVRAPAWCPADQDSGSSPCGGATGASRTVTGIPYGRNRTLRLLSVLCLLARRASSSVANTCST